MRMRVGKRERDNPKSRNGMTVLAIATFLHYNTQKRSVEMIYTINHSYKRFYKVVSALLLLSL